MSKDEVEIRPVRDGRGRDEERLTSRLVDHDSLPHHPTTGNESLEHCVDDEVGSQGDDSNGESTQLRRAPFALVPVEGRVRGRDADCRRKVGRRSIDLAGGESRNVLGGSRSSWTDLEENGSCSATGSKEEDGHDD